MVGFGIDDFCTTSQRFGPPRWSKKWDFLWKRNAIVDFLVPVRGHWLAALQKPNEIYGAFYFLGFRPAKNENGTFPEEIEVIYAQKEVEFVGFTSKTRHLRNRTSVEKYSNTGTVLKMMIFAQRPHENELRDGPKSGISSGNVSPKSLFRHSKTKK